MRGVIPQRASGSSPFAFGSQGLGLAALLLFLELFLGPFDVAQ